MYEDLWAVFATLTGFKASLESVSDFMGGALGHPWVYNNSLIMKATNTFLTVSQTSFATHGCYCVVGQKYGFLNKSTSKDQLSRDRKG